MSYSWLLILAIPSIIHLFKFPEFRSDIVIQLIITLGLLFLGWRIFRAGGCLRILGLLMVLLGIVAYYYLIVTPFFTGQIITLGIIK